MQQDQVLLGLVTLKDVVLEDIRALVKNLDDAGAIHTVWSM